jgi:hypothetical protein
MNTNGIKDPEINSHSYSQPILNKAAKIYTGEKTVSSTNGTGKTGYSLVKG